MRFKQFCKDHFVPVQRALIEVALERRTVGYKELLQMQEVGLPDNELKPYMWQRFLPWMLDEINIHETIAGRPLLSALVVSKDSKLPGDGFFFSLTVGRLLEPAGATEAKKRAVHEEELGQIYAHWAECRNTDGHEDFAEKYHLVVHKVLVDIASKGETITYGDLAREANLPEGAEAKCKLYQLLCEENISEWEIEWPMLSAVVVDKASNLPSLEFFRLAAFLGNLPAGADMETKENFWKKELKQVHEKWTELAKEEEEDEA